VATLLWAAEPGLIVALAWFLLRERISASLVALTATAGAGVILAGGGGSGTDLANAGWGAALILTGVLCCALYAVIYRGIATDLHPLAVVAVQQTVGLAWVAAISPFEWGATGVAPLLALTPVQWLGALASGLMYYAIAYWFYLRGLRAMPASRAGNFLNLIPVFGIAAAALFLGERLSATQWAGAALILGSVLLLQSLLGATADAERSSNVH
jgi:drug/metabolite transporter (DMT)-like permease